MASDKDIQWITVNGRHIPLHSGESKADAIKRAVGDTVNNNEDEKEKQLARNKAEKDSINKKSNLADEGTQTEHKNAIKELNQSKYPDGTYDIHTKTTKEFDSGYQVTFCQIGDNYSDAEYAKKVNECLAMSDDGKTYAGKFESEPEISFHWKDRKQAEEYARANNQISIWDWKQWQTTKQLAEKYGWDDIRTIEANAKCTIETGGTGRRKEK